MSHELNSVHVSNCSKKSKEFLKESYVTLSLARFIMAFVTDKKQEFKDHLLKRKHPEKNHRLPLLKIISTYETSVITFTRTCNSNHQFYFKQFKNCIKNTANRELQKAFNDKKNTPYYTATKEIRKYPSASKS